MRARLTLAGGEDPYWGFFLGGGGGRGPSKELPPAKTVIATTQTTAITTVSGPFDSVQARVVEEQELVGIPNTHTHTLGSILQSTKRMKKSSLEYGMEKGKKCLAMKQGRVLRKER